MTNDKGALALDIFENPMASYWLIEFWRKRDEVTPENQCPVVLQYEDGTETRCVIEMAHMDGETLKANVPHVTEGGQLAPLMFSWETIQAHKNRRTHDIQRGNDQGFHREDAD